VGFPLLSLPGENVRILGFWWFKCREDESGYKTVIWKKRKKEIGDNKLILEFQIAHLNTPIGV
jgi:hypothetical protein